MCKQRIVDLFPKLERSVENIKAAEAQVMQMQMKRQKEFWYLLKIACVRIQQMALEYTQMLGSYSCMYLPYLCLCIKAQESSQTQLLKQETTGR